jgi:hypothetical protein
MEFGAHRNIINAMREGRSAERVWSLGNPEFDIAIFRRVICPAPTMVQGIIRRSFNSSHLFVQGPLTTESNVA